MEYRRCQLPCAHFIVSDDPHSKCVKCMFFFFCTHTRRFMGCRNIQFAKTSVSKPSALGLRFLKGSHPCFPVTPRRPHLSPSLAPSWNSRPSFRLSRVGAFHESATWGSDVELGAMESEQMGLAFSLPLSRARKFAG